MAMLTVRVSSRFGRPSELHELALHSRSKARTAQRAWRRRAVEELRPRDDADDGEESGKVALVGFLLAYHPAAVRPSSSPTLWMVILTPLVIGAFMAAHLLTGGAARELSLHASRIQIAARRAQQFSVIRGKLHGMGMVAAQAEHGEAFERIGGLEAKTAIGEELGRLREMPARAGDPEVFLAVTRAVHAASSAIERIAGRSTPDANDASADESSIPAIRRSDDVLERLIGSEIANVDAESARITAIEARVARLGPVYDAVAGAFVLLLMGFTVAASRQYARAAEERKRDAERRAEELDAFAGRVAHDLRNPLSAISLRAAVDAQRFADDSAVREEFVKAGEAALRMNRIIEGLLTFARAGGRPESDGRAEVWTVIPDVVADFGADAALVDAELTVEPLPRLAVACPPGPLSSVVGNLVRNAVKFVADGTNAQRCIRVRAFGHAGHVRIEVDDTGPGVPAGMEEAIFEPFVRATNGDRPGLGLGLATVKRLVDAYGGRVGVSRRVCGGSCFTVDLPLAS